MRNSGTEKKEAKYSSQDTYPRSIIFPLAFHQCPSLFHGMCLLHKTMSSGSDHKPGKWEGAKVFCAASMLWSCCSAVESAEPKIMHLISCNLGLWEWGWQNRSCQLASPHQGHALGPLCSQFQFVACHGGSPKGLKQSPRNWPRANTHKQMTQLLNYLALLSPQTTSAGRSSSCSERNAFVLGGMEWKNAPCGKGSKKPVIKLVL